MRPTSTALSKSSLVRSLEQRFSTGLPVGSVRNDLSYYTFQSFSTVWSSPELFLYRHLLLSQAEN